MQKVVEGKKIAKGEKKEKDHTGCFGKMTWDKAGLENEIRNYESEVVIN